MDVVTEIIVTVSTFVVFGFGFFVGRIASHCYPY